MIKELTQLEQLEYYHLNQLITNNLTNLKIRQLKRRVKEVASELNNNLLTKEGRFWKIHKSIVNRFQRERSGRNALKTEVTINLIGNYDKEYYSHVAERIYSHQPGKKFRYSVETSPEGKIHLHIATGVNQTEARVILKKIEMEFQQIILFNPHTHVSEINDVNDWIGYISKQMKPIVLK